LAFLIQIGGFGIIGFATLVGFLIEGRVSLKNRISATSESSATKQPDIRTLLKNIAKLMLFFQLVLFLFLVVRFFFEYDYSFDKALAHGGFHAISAFNQAGFALYTDSLMGFAGDLGIIGPVFIISTLAGFGFPVMAEMRDRLKLRMYALVGKSADYTMPAQWSLNSRIILYSSLVLLIVGAIGIAVSEWYNPRTLGAMDPRGIRALRRSRNLDPRGDAPGIRRPSRRDIPRGRHGADAGDARHLPRVAGPPRPRQRPLSPV
jgi:Trk-type K+ transport system membrane component